MATTGEWGGLQVRLDIPELQDAVSVVSGVFDLVIAALDIALSVLNIIKSFASSLLNPARVLIQELIAQLQNLLLDFRKAGFYVNGDWYLLGDTTFDQLRGGYAGYQQRMITRLMDRTDPNRPVFTDSTTVLALFLYVGARVQFVDGLATFEQFGLIEQLLSAFAEFFGFNVNGTPLPIPTGLRSNFAGGATRLPTGGASASSVATFRAANSVVMGRTSTILQWSLAPSPGTNPATPSPVVPPDGFLVELSVWPQGLYAGYLAPTPGSTGGPDGVPPEGSSETPSSYSTGLYLEADTGRPLQIFGGKDSVLLDASVSWDEAFDGGTLRPGARPAFFLRNLTDTQFIRTNVFDGPDSTVYYNQRTLYVPHAEVLTQSLVGGVYSLELSEGDLPLETPIAADGTPEFEKATRARTVYVRVLSCSDRIVGKDGFQWKVVPVETPESVKIQPKGGIPPSARSTPSEVLSVTFPSVDSNLYLQALNTALAVMILSRSDLQLPSETLDPSLKEKLNETVTISGRTVTRGSTFTPTGLEPFAQNLLPLFGNPQDYFAQSAPPSAFGNDLRGKIGVLADQILESQGNLPEAVLATRRDRFTRLVEWKWSETEVEGASGDENLKVSILQSLTASDAEGEPFPVYVAKNASSLAGYETDPVASAIEARDRGVLATYPASGFGVAIPGIPRVRKTAPIVALREGEKAWYARALISEEIYEISREVLGLAATEMTASGGWIAIRPFQSVGTLSGVQDVSSLLQNFLEGIGAGLQGGEDLILNFISMLEQRVREIQEVIRRIRSYLAIPLSIEIPDAVGLVLVANGTNGVISGLTTSTNAPTDESDSYAGGLVILGGGVPALITDLIMLLVSS